MADAMTLICPHCTVSNTVPSDCVNHQAYCGRCGKILFAGKPLILTEATFDLHTADSDLPVVVDFWAPWNELSRQMVRLLLAAAPQLEPRCRLGRVNIEEEQNLTQRLGIQIIPSLVTYIRGKEWHRHSGPMTAAELERWIDWQASYNAKA